MNKLPKLVIWTFDDLDERVITTDGRDITKAQALEVIHRCEAYEIYKTQFSAAMRAKSLGLCKKAIKHALDNEQALSEAEK